MPNSQKFVARNRAPRVHIEYDVHLPDGSRKKVELPFVIGVMADLSGKPAQTLPSLDQREFLEIDVDNFDRRMKVLAPRVAFEVPNTLTGHGNIPVDLTFETITDFSPAAVARKVEPLRKLLEARAQLSALNTRLDGRAEAEKLVSQMLGDRTLMQSLVAAPRLAEQPQS